MKDLKQGNNSELKAGAQDRDNLPKTGAYNPQQNKQQPLNKTQQPLPGKGQNIGGGQGGVGGTTGNVNKDKGIGTGVDKDKGGSWK